jgi:uncharacterized membrane protein (DUF106 family)
MVNFWTRILEPDIMPFVVAIVAIIAGTVTGASIKITKMLITHHERIALIQHGIHPDYPPENKDEV